MTTQHTWDASNTQERTDAEAVFLLWRKQRFEVFYKDGRPMDSFNPDAGAMEARHSLTSEAARVARQIHTDWPFIPEDDARQFYLSLQGISGAEGAVRVSLWVLARVIEAKLTK